MHISRNRLIGMLLASAIATLPATVQAAPAAAGKLAVPATGLTVEKTASYNSLTIPQGATLAAPKGKSLTLTVDGVSTTIAPGTYTGKVVLTVTDDIPVKYHDLDPHHYRTAAYIENGAPVASKSVAAAIRAGTVNDGQADGVVISSKEDRFNGIMVTGEGSYVINNPVIDLVGNGGNDFAGFGAAIMSNGKTELTVNNPKIRTQGAVRTAMFVGGHSVMRVNNADIEVKNGTLPPDYKFTIEVGKMMEVPWMLGLTGNVRATNLVDYGTIYYTNSRIRAQGWGAMSTDDAAVVRMYVKDSLIETVESGYGAYSIGDSLDHFSHSILNVADIGVIMAGPGSATFTDGTVVNSGRYGVMAHSGQSGGTLTIDKGSVLNTKKTAILSKGMGITVKVDSAVINPGNGVIVQAMENDDPYMKQMMAGAGGPGGPGGAPGGAGGPGGAPGGTEIVGIQGGAAMPEGSPDLIGTFSNVTLKGDFFNGRTKQGGMKLTFTKADVTGVISISETSPATGKDPTRETLQEIGNVVNKVGPTTTKNGLDLTLADGARWTVTGASYLTGLDIAAGAEVLAPVGHKLQLTVDGKKVALKPGKYQGAIVLNLL